MNYNPTHKSSSGKVKLIMIFLSFVFFSNGYGQVTVNPGKPFIDTTDGAFDVSYYLYNLHGFLLNYNSINIQSIFKRSKKV